MPNSKNNVKSNGVVLFAFNTDVDYVKIADQTSKLIAHNLKLPVTLITGPDTKPRFEYDQVIRVDPVEGNIRLNADMEEVKWNNFGRYLAYRLSPYDTTILLDTDYLVLDNSLLTLLKTNHDYLLQYHNVTDQGTK